MYVETPLKTEEFDFTKIEVIEVDPVVTLLEKALKKLSRPGGWIKHAFRRTIKNRKTGKAMYGYCMIGVVRSMSAPANVKLGALCALEDVIPGGDIAYFNDNDARSFSEVESMFQKAIRNRERNARR